MPEEAVRVRRMPKFVRPEVYERERRAGLVGEGAREEARRRR